MLNNLNSVNHIYTESSATLLQVLEIAGLLNAYNEYSALFSRAEAFFVQGDSRAAFNVLYKIWMDPHFVPALLLYECFYARQLILPTWNCSDKLFVQNMFKNSGGTRPIIIANKSTRICMGVINSLLQSACKSWSNRTTGFRPGSGTQTAISLLAQSSSRIMHTHGQVYILSLDIQKAFNSVNIDHLFYTLGLNALPHKIKQLIWKWHHSPIHNSGHLVSGLAQGFSYSPTLFAWYLDTLVVQHCSMIAYADNFAGVYKSKSEAQDAVNNILDLLRPSGLTIKENSIRIYVYCESSNYPHNQYLHFSDSAQSLYPWLGHALALPDCSVIYNKFQQKAAENEPVAISLDMWDSMLQNSNWVHKVHNIDWRF
ncbi:reverse transcriptase-like protein (mitochondrion) [Astrephomene gubernaculifera]|nr:reverse transcriptase-like protein [Astrephomene gubernaculifera]